MKTYLTIKEETVIMDDGSEGNLMCAGQRIKARNIIEAEARLSLLNIPNCKIVGELIHESDTDLEYEIIMNN